MRVAAIQTTAGPDREPQPRRRPRALVEEAAGPGRRAGGAPRVLLGGRRPRLPAPPRRAADRAHRDLGLATWPGGWGSTWWPAASPSGAGAGGRRPGGRLFNTSCLIGPTGAIEAVYRKIHLFDVTPGRRRLPRVGHHGAGRRAVRGAPRAASDRSGTAAPVLGLSLCYDLRFPEIYRIMALLGATVMAVPAAFTAATGPAHWELLLRARAVENQVFVIGAGQVGDLPPGMPACHGHSMIVDPWGTVLAERTEPEPGGGPRRPRRRTAAEDPLRAAGSG